MVEMEKIALATIWRQNNKTYIEQTPDIDNYELFGILYTFAMKLKNDLETQWNIDN